ncbi:hypothetical protein GCM10022226_39750 [Sphaerisporangium flaviroseum]|uniref:Pyruvate, water dikinase n=1 Tax=Sphaerisporangium flaviroseum TaxID=509199 RepID=A0ABP7ICB0_9ACTN
MIINLAAAAGLGRERIGGKADALALLAAEGFPVPDGFVVPADATPSAAELRRAADGLGDGPFAVRSSAVAEDLPGASYAGLYETCLDVPAPEVADAVARCREAARAERVLAYHVSERGDGVAVLVQPMVAAQAAGVAFTANPLSGDRDETVITAVRGLGEPLVSGAVTGEEWVVRRKWTVHPPHQPPSVLNAGQARDVARLAWRVQERFGSPQDIEWAIEAGQVRLLQARAMTALPEPVSWKAPGPGLWLRNFRLGEWLPDPVTPLFADWLLARIDEGFRAGMRDTAGAAVRFPYAIVNGWYYTHPTPAFGELPGALIRSRGRLLPFMRNALLRPGRDPAAAHNALLDRLHEQWLERELPAYQELLDQPPADELIDAIGHAAGRQLWYLAVLGGAAWKMESCLTRFLGDHDLADINAPSLLTGLTELTHTAPSHAVHSIDWYHPTAGELQAATVEEPAPRQEAARLRAEAEHICRERLRPPALTRFTALLQTTRHYTAVRERQARDLTLGWPLLRACVLRIGRRLAESGGIDTPDDVFFLTRVELHRPPSGRAKQRRTAWQQQRRLAAPLSIGSPPPLIGRHLEHTLGLTRHGALTGQPASPGRAGGPACIVHDLSDADRVQPGDVLVARTTAPAWTPLFARVAAVVTDGGTLAAHASLIAREYGIPAVVATGDATVRLHDGQYVIVDGTRGWVETPS